MKKQIITTGLIILLIVAIGGAIYIFRNNQAVENSRLTENIETDLMPVKKLNCDGLEPNEKAVCLAGVAQLLNSDNSSACDSLTAEVDKTACRQSYIIKQAASSGDLKPCGQITDKTLAADCSAQASFSLAIQKKDKKYCENIINKTDKDGCFKVLAGMGVK